MIVTFSDACAVIAAEIATAQERNAHRVQVTVADACHLDADERRRNIRFRLERYGRSAISEVQRQAIGYSGGCNTARLGKIVSEASDSEIHGRSVVSLRTGVQVQRRCVQQVGFESEIGCCR